MHLSQQPIPKRAARVAAVTPSFDGASEPLSNFVQVECRILGVWDTPARILSVFQPLDTVLFYIWLGAYTASMPRKLVWTEKQNFQASVAPSATGCLSLLARPFTNHWMK